MLKIILLIAAVSADGFAASAGMGAAGIKVPLRSAAIISFTGTLFLTCSVALADGIKRFVPDEACRAVSFALLVFLGLFNIFRDFFKKLAERRKKSNSEKPDTIRLLFDGTAADTDNSKSISVREAAALSVALSADSLVTGISAGLGEINLPLLCVGTFAAGLLSVAFGQWLGRKIASSLEIDMGWLCGAVLIVLALLK